MIDRVLAIKSKHVVTETQIVSGWIIIRNERIISIQPNPPYRAMGDNIEILDWNDMVIFPGVVDIHEHVDDPGRETWEDYESATKAAAAGGITTVVDMPVDSDPPTVTVESLTNKRKTASTKAIVDYGQWVGLTPDNVTRMERFISLGIIGFKAFMCDPGLGNSDLYMPDGALWDALSEAARLNAVVAVHAENNDLTAGVSSERPLIAEVEATVRVLSMAEQCNSRVHIVHASHPSVIEVITTAKARGVQATVETCPHYLLFDARGNDSDQSVKCAPPLRRDVRHRLKALLSHEIDVIASDHSPCACDGNPCHGVTGNQLMFLHTLEILGARDHLTVLRAAQLCSTRPAQVAGIYPKKGSIRIGSDADLVAVRVDDPWTVECSNLYQKNPQCNPYIGMTLTNRVVYTMVRGVVVWSGQHRVLPGYGQLVIPGL